MSGIIEITPEEVILGEISEQIRHIEDKVIEVNTEGINKMKIMRQYKENTRRNDRNSSSRYRSGSRASTNRDRIRCYKCRECDCFTKDCLTSKLEKETEQVQQMYNMDEEQTSLKY